MSLLLSSNPLEKQADTRPLYLRLEELLKEQINQDFAPNQKFYSVRQLVQRHDVSTITVTRALRDLVNEGFLYSKHGKGMFVRGSFSCASEKQPKDKNSGLVISIPMHKSLEEIFSDRQGISKDYLLGITDAANEYGAVAQIQVVPREKAGSFNYQLLNNAANSSFQGVILYGSTEYDFPSMLDLAIDRHVPYVALQPERGLNWQQIERRNIHYVTINQQGGLRQATSHLLELGHKRIAYWQHKRTAFTRFSGFKLAMRQAGAIIDESLIERDFNFNISCIAALKNLIDCGVTALVTASDYIAIKVLREATKAGISIPDELSVTGFDDNPIAKDLTPALTTVSVDRYEAGRQVTLALLKQVNNPEKTDERYQAMVPVELVVRNSTRRSRLAPTTV